MRPRPSPGSSGAMRAALSFGIPAFLIAVLFALPLVLMATGSFRQPGLPPPRGIELVPSERSLDAYRDAFTLAPLARSLANSSLVAAIAVPLTILTASLAGFAVAQAPPRRRARLTATVLLLLMVPLTSLWVTRFVLFRTLHLVDSYVPLVAPALMGGSPFFVLLYVYAFRRIPADVLDAARLEGAGPLSLWRRVAMPLARPTTTAVALLAFVLFWSDFINPLLYIGSERRFTAPLVLRSLEQLGPTNWPVLLAASVVVVAPVALAFGFAQRAFLAGERGLGWLGR